MALAMQESGSSGWIHWLGDIIHDACVCPTHLRRMRIVGDEVPEEEKDNNAGIVVDFMALLLHEVVLRFYAQLDHLPNAAVGILNKDKKIAMTVIQEFLEQWTGIVTLELQKAKGDDKATRLLSYILHARMPVLRVLYTVLEHEYHLDPTKPGPLGLHVAKCLSRKFPDEKLVEDVNNFIRDLSRQKKHKCSPMERVFARVLKSEALSSRGLKEPTVSNAEIAATKNFKGACHTSCKKMFQPRIPGGLPLPLNRILTNKQSWPSPAAKGLAESALALAYLETSIHDGNEDWDQGWATLLCDQQWVLTNEETGEIYWVLLGGAWSVPILSLTEAPGIHSSSTFILPSTEKAIQESFGTLSVCCPFTFAAQKAKGVRITVDGAQQLGLTVPCEKVPLLLLCLRARKEFTLWQLKRAVESLPDDAQPRVASYSRKLYLQRLVAHLAPSEVDDIMALYAQKVVPQPEGEDQEIEDPDLIELMEEMAVSDMVNSNDLKCFKQELKAKTVQKLQARRQVARDETEARKQAKAKAAREKKQQAAAARKARKFKRSRKPMLRPRRRGPANGGLAPEPPAPDGPSPPSPAEGHPPGPSGAPAPPPPPQHGGIVPLVQPPVEGEGDWRRLELPGIGWFMYSERLSRLDSHCMMHRGCRMNRTLRRGCVGLCTAWLQATADCLDKEAHDTMKLVLSREESRDDREAGRRMFNAAAIEGGAQGLFAQVVAQEIDARGGDTAEPRWLQCNPPRRQRT